MTSDFTVAICTIGQEPKLRLTLEALTNQTVTDFSILIINNAPHNPEAEELIQASLAGLNIHVEVVSQPLPGLSNARNAAIAATKTTYLAFTDDDAVPDASWVQTLQDAVKAAGPTPLHCLTGLVEAAETTNKTSQWFEEFGGFGKGNKPLIWRQTLRTDHLEKIYTPGPKGIAFPYTGSEFGSGNNMTFHLPTLKSIGGFDSVLGAGTPSRGGEDLDIFRRFYLAGKTIVYLPNAVVKHHHRSTYEDLRTQLYGYGSGMSAALAKLCVTAPQQGLKLALKLPRSLVFLLNPKSDKNTNKSSSYPKELTRVELQGYLAGPWLYAKGHLKQKRLKREAKTSVAGA